MATGTASGSPELPEKLALGRDSAPARISYIFFKRRKETPQKRVMEMSLSSRGAVSVFLVGAVAAGVTTLSACGSQDAAAAAPPTSSPADTARSQARGLALADPTGPYTVGRDSLHLVDKSRPDPWVPKAGHRELMVSMYYPAHKATGKTTPYMSTKGADAFLKQMELDVPAKTIAGTKTHTHTGARPATGKFPLIVLSPGFKTPGATLTGLAEDLTSRGNVVAVVDHAYEAAGVSFPGKGILPCAACGKVGPTTFQPAAEGRAKDISFTLDQLLSGTSPWKRAGMVDKNKVGMAGHSLGGASTAATMEKDSRVRAGVNMDGPYINSGLSSGLSGRPFMMLGTKADHSPGGDATWDTAWKQLEGWKRWATLTGAEHMSFTDLAPLAGQLGADDPEGLPGKRAAEITRDYVGAFFDKQLHGKHEPLLDHPSKTHPEVTLQHHASENPSPRS
ncbi:alpha/beta hydrolase family protein [Streptomyces sp. NPDC057966]|uniref:alpha/beta hydrolase family protein n=2 Tax=Streptomyces TaxID=1883 RepID=UPI0036E345EF